MNKGLCGNGGTSSGDSLAANGRPLTSINSGFLCPTTIGGEVGCETTGVGCCGVDCSATTALGLCSCVL